MDRRFRLTVIHLLLSLLLAGTTMPVNAQMLLEYRHSEGDKWHLTSEVVEEVLVNDELYWEAEILNKISVEVLAGDGRDGYLWNRYSIAESRPESDVYTWAAEYESAYGRDSRGRLSGIPADAIVPTVRNVPVYPEYELKPGDTWEAPGLEVYDLDPTFGIPVVLKIDFDASYRYDERVERNTRQLESVTIEYSFDWSPDANELAGMRRYPIYPIYIEGRFHQEVLYDAAAGRNFAENGIFSYSYYMSDGQTYTFRGTSRGQAVYVDELDRDALIEEIEDLEREDIRAEAVDEGVKISLEDINFVPDEAVMLPGQEGKLEGILDILGRYPDRDVQVVGHTAKIVGGSDGQILSEERAGTVARIILESGVRSRDQLTIRGMGNRRPIGDNSTEEGRRLNRRVEIIILEN